MLSRKRNDLHAWGQESFASVFDFLSNNTLSRAELTEEGGEVKDVHYGDVLIKFGEVLDPSKESIPFVSSLEKKSIPSKDFLKDGDVIIADTAEDATVGKCTEIVNSNGYSLVSGLHTFPIRPRKAFGKGYLGFYMNSNSYHNQLVPYMQGIKVTSLSRSAMLNTTIAYPKDISEQEKIGGAFFQIDSLLSLHQRKQQWNRWRRLLHFQQDFTCLY